jgi:hypothetical protein
LNRRREYDEWNAVKNNNNSRSIWFRVKQTRGYLKEHWIKWIQVSSLNQYFCWR